MPSLVVKAVSIGGINDIMIIALPAAGVDITLHRYSVVLRAVACFRFSSFLDDAVCSVDLDIHMDVRDVRALQRCTWTN